MKRSLALGMSAMLTIGLLSGCGTTSDIRKHSATAGDNAAQSEQQTATAPAVDFTKYNTVVVLDFENKAMPADKAMGQRFAEKIALSVLNTGAFQKVERTPQAEPAIVIDGAITRYEEGDPTMRFLIGLGAGSSYFDAIVNLTDGQSGEKLGDILVDKNSWVLGGGIAASQDVNSHMQSAAETIAENLASAKQGKELKTAQADE